MSYRNLHIALLISLIIFDLCMLNLAGIGAFWLRCRTALFEEGTLQSVLVSPSSLLKKCVYAKMTVVFPCGLVL